MILQPWQPRNGCWRSPNTVVVLILMLLAFPACALWQGAHATPSMRGASTLSGGISDGEAAKLSRSLLNLQSNNRASTVKGSAANAVGQQQQQQQQRPPLVVPQCYWNSEAQVCDADDAVNIMYAIKARPLSAYLWFLLMTYDRETVCGVHTTATDCRGDTANRCVYFDDILNIIGGSKGSSSSSTSQASSSSNSNSAADAMTASGNIDSSSNSSLKTQLYAEMLLMLQHDEVRQQLQEQLLSPVEQQQQQQFKQDHFFAWPGNNAAVAPAAAAVTVSIGYQQQQQHEENVQATTVKGSAEKGGGSGNKPAAKPILKPPTTATAGRTGGSSSSRNVSNPSPKPNKESAAASAAPQQPQNGSSSSTAPAPARKQILCTSADLLENYIFTRSAYSTPLQAPLALHCPGSKAYQLIRCIRQPSLVSCRATPGCVVVPGSPGSGTDDMCVSQHVQDLDKAAIKQFTYETTLAEPSAVGSCDGACWMRQALLCNRTTSSEACAALTFCRSSPSGLCTPRLYMQDNFGSSVQEYMGECVDVDNQKDCESLSLKLINKGAYAEWQMPRTANWKCSVPSIGGLLGTRAEPHDPGQTIIADSGQLEERAAGAKAAAAAAAAAANAARLVLDRGPGMLQQIYFTEGRPQFAGRR